MGNDFRAAYAPGVTLDGSGQAVAIVSFAPYFPSNIALYEKTAGLPPVTVTNVLLDNLTGIPPPGLDDGEQAGDLELVIAMAPGAQVLCYEGSIEVDIFNRIATDNLAKQVSTSVGYGAPTPPALEQILMEFAAQGQTMFAASGDSGAWSSSSSTGIGRYADDPYVTSVGGTILTTSRPGGEWQSETAWSGSGGGATTNYPIPSWQKGIDMTANGGSTTMRNYPDVSIVAYGPFNCARQGQCSYGAGTSASAPL